MNCSVCGERAAGDEVQFCESCGEPLRVEAVSSSRCSCGSDEGTDDEGFCLGCGRRIARPASDHVEEELSARLAAVSDRGLVHACDEDRFVIRQSDDWAVLVVCDGVSSSRHAGRAAETAARTLAAHLQAGLEGGLSLEGQALLTEAFTAAKEVLRPVKNEHEAGDAGATTAVAAVVRAGRVFVGWMGDSRAYWVGAAGVRQLTQDHSWLRETVAAGEMPLELAQGAWEAHAITRWLGGEVDGEGVHEQEPEFTEFVVPEADGLLLLCSDGLWNELPDEEQMRAEIAEGERKAATCLELARGLAEFSLARGGKDNVTVALWRSAPLGNVT